MFGVFLVGTFCLHVAVDQLCDVLRCSVLALVALCGVTAVFKELL